MNNKEQLEYLIKVGFDPKTANQIINENKGEEQDHRASTWISYDAKTGETVLEATGAIPNAAEKKYKGSKFLSFLTGKHFLCRSGTNAKKEVAKFVIPLALVASAYFVKGNDTPTTDHSLKIESIQEQGKKTPKPLASINIQHTDPFISDIDRIENAMDENTYLDKGKFSALKEKDKIKPEIKKEEPKKSASPSSVTKKLSEPELDKQLKELNVPTNILNLYYGKSGTDIVRKQVFAELFGKHKYFTIDAISPILKSAEGYKETPYLDTGFYQVETIGYGTTGIVRTKKGWEPRPIAELTEMAHIGEFKMNNKPMTKEQIKAMHTDLKKLSSIMNDLTCMYKAKKSVLGEEVKISQKEKDRAYILQKELKMGISPIINKLKQDMHKVMENNPNFEFKTNESASIKLAHAFLAPLLATSIQKIKTANPNYEFNPEKDFKNPMFLIIVSQAFQKGNAVDSGLLKHFANDNAGAFFHHLLCVIETTTPGRTVKEAIEILESANISDKHLLSIQTALFTKKADFEKGFSAHKKVAHVVIGKKADKFNHKDVTLQINQETNKRKLVNVTLAKLTKDKKTI